MSGPRNVLVLTLRLIAVATIVSGIIQLAAPSFVLGLVGGDANPAALHFFGIVGMFMALFGVLMIVGLSPGVPRAPLLIAGLQKFGAAIAVALGIWRGIFGAAAWPVAGFDLLTGILVVVHLAKTSAPDGN
jgi:hypothetical protein